MIRMGMLDKMRGKDAPASKVVDPVCGMTIDPAKAAGTSEFEGRRVHFCSAGCKQKFDADPSQYAGKLPRA